MKEKKVVAFQSPDSLRISISLPNPFITSEGLKTEITGMGIKRGVTLIVGGGYHGKSTLLQALQRCVYPHIPGDGREYVVTCRDCVKIRAEDGRFIQNVDISPFISSLPFGEDTKSFSTPNASGSTSQAANIMEALEIGAKLLLLDEDTSATNFMIRDARMQALVEKTHEPITPFIDRVRELYENLGVSTVLVMGGCGDYIDVADTVIMMRNFLPVDVTREAKRIASIYTTTRKIEKPCSVINVTPRVLLSEGIDPYIGKKKIKIEAKTLDTLIFGRQKIDLRFIEQLVDTSQARAIGYAIFLAKKRFINNTSTLEEIVDAIEDLFNKEGLDVLDPFYGSAIDRHPGNFARPRRYEIAAALNRLNTITVKQKFKTVLKASSV